ncbi:hypothetical protein NSP_2740 [Nodularia spumigena CCY9414]|nr:hypothetical protein NSP_2740 [Nodularia spumigena CCY9414]
MISSGNLFPDKTPPLAPPVQARRGDKAKVWQVFAFRKYSTGIDIIYLVSGVGGMRTKR